MADRLLDQVESLAEVVRRCDVSHQVCDRSPELDLEVLVDVADVIEEATHVRRGRWHPNCAGAVVRRFVA